jgi:DNA-binding XRE family transcriptional regulator
MNLILLKKERIKRGFTQEKMAQLLGFKSKSSYCLIEKGKVGISVDIAGDIAKQLGLSKKKVVKIFFDDLF